MLATNNASSCTRALQSPVCSKWFNMNPSSFPKRHLNSIKMSLLSFIHVLVLQMFFLGGLFTAIYKSPVLRKFIAFLSSGMVLSVISIISLEYIMVSYIIVTNFEILSYFLTVLSIQPNDLQQLKQLPSKVHTSSIANEWSKKSN